MISPFKAIVSVASAAVIAASTVYISGELSESRDEAKAKEARVSAWVAIKKADLAAKSRAEIDGCVRDLDAYDKRSDSRAFIQRAAAESGGVTADAMLSAVAKCRGVVRLATPSEPPE